MARGKNTRCRVTEGYATRIVRLRICDVRSSDTVSDKIIELLASIGGHFRYFILEFWYRDDGFRGIAVKKIETGAGETQNEEDRIMTTKLDDYNWAGSRVIDIGEINYGFDIYLVRDPITELQQCISTKRFFEGIVLATSYYQVLAVDKIIRYLKKKKKSVDVEKIKRMQLSEIIFFLYCHDIISESENTQMIEVNKYRNEVVHFLIKKIDPEIATKLIEYSIDCWKLLFPK